MENTKSYLKNHWGVLARIILTPETLFLNMLILAMITSTYFISLSGNALVLVLVVSVLALLSGLLGSYLTSAKAKVIQKEVVRERGYITIRSLNLLLSHIHSIKKRMNVYMQEFNNQDINHDLLRSHFGEIVEKCNNLFEDAVNSIESWQDVIPEANLRNQIRKVSNLKAEMAQCINDLKELQILNSKVGKDVNVYEQGRLSMSIEDMDKKLTNLRELLLKEEDNLLIDHHLYEFEEGKISFSDTINFQSSRKKQKNNYHDIIPGGLMLNNKVAAQVNNNPVNGTFINGSH